MQRGFERMFADLFELMRDETDITLFKGAGPVSANEKVPVFVHRNSRVIRALPVHRIFGRTPFHTECMLFALGMLPYLRNGAFEVVHTIDAPLTRVLFRWRALLGLRFRLLFTEGTGMPAADYPPADHTHQVAAVTMDKAIADGMCPADMTLVPCGFYPERFAVARTRSQLRQDYGIGRDVFVVVSVAALNRSHKRIDYLIDEMASVEGNVLLLLDGSTDHGDPGLAGYARDRLGDRVRVSHVASGKVGELYAMGDVLAHVATREAFGLSIVEAAASGMPVICHDGPHFRWLLPNPACWIDASQPGALAARLGQVMADRSQLDRMRADGVTTDRFSWQRLKPSYADLYRHAAALPLPHGRPAAAHPLARAAATDRIPHA